MEAKNEIQKTESPLTAAAALVSADGNMDVAKLKELLDVQERWEANQAKKAYVVAMSEFKAHPPEILKDKAVSYKQTHYKHSSLHNVTTKINAELSKHGLTASWVTSQDNGSVKVTCKITHVMGHSEETSLSAPPDATGSKNAIQAIGSTVTYLQRYTLLALTGLATCDQDDDGGGAGKKPSPKLPELTDKNKDALNAIFPILRKSLPDDIVIDKDLVTAIFLRYKGYPTQVDQADKAAAWLITNSKPETWTKPKAETKSDPDDWLDMHCKACGRNFGQDEIVMTDEGGVCPNCDSNNPDDIELQSEREDV